MRCCGVFLPSASFSTRSRELHLFASLHQALALVYSEAVTHRADKVLLHKQWHVVQSCILRMFVHTTVYMYIQAGAWPLRAHRYAV